MTRDGRDVTIELMLKRLAPRSALAIVVLLCSALAANAQSTTGSLSGVIKDPSGGVLPGADIVVVHAATGLERHQVSDATGFYRVLNLTPGEYILTAQLSGFRVRRIEPLTAERLKQGLVGMRFRSVTGHGRPLSSLPYSIYD